MTEAQKLKLIQRIEQVERAGNGTVRVEIVKNHVVRIKYGVSEDVSQN